MNMDALDASMIACIIANAVIGFTVASVGRNGGITVIGIPIGRRLQIRGMVLPIMERQL